MKEKRVKRMVKDRYSKIARDSSCCSGCGAEMSNEQISRSIGYSDKDIQAVPDANLGLGCGNPTALGEIREGEVVLDLGSGAGFDCFLSAKKVGPKGKVIGIDMTEEMIEKAKENAERYGYSNVEFRLGDIEDLPIEDSSVDVIISNCVINLAPDKSNVFREAFRILKKGGRMYVSDIVLLRELSAEQRADEDLIAGCVGGALLKGEYLRIVRDAGFNVSGLSEDSEISKRQYQGLPIESLKIVAQKK